MKNMIQIILLFVGATLFANVTPNTVKSPTGNHEVAFKLVHGTPYYSVVRNGEVLLNWSRLGLEFSQLPSLGSNLTLINTETTSFDETWEQPWGEEKSIRNHYNALKVQLQEGASKLKYSILFKAYDDGVAFRYEFPKQAGIANIEITDELTEFNMIKDYQAWWVPAYQDNRYEYLYEKSKISELDIVHTPFTMEDEQVALSIHEAALTNFASMTLESRGKGKLKANLVPWSDGIKVKLNEAFVSPWRTIQIADKATELITSYMILNLNEPNKLGDVSWCKPAKYIGIWWGMHVGKYTWGPGEKHGATTAITKEYLRFAAKHGFDGVLVEGWNKGWDTWPNSYDNFNYTEAYPDFDMDKLAKYAKRKKVSIIGHHETAANTESYEAQANDAFAYYNRYGIRYVKSGYVGSRINKTEWHHGQYGVNHYRNILKAAAKHKIVMDVHEPIKPTGMRRTYPNMMSREGARGMEFDAWSSDGGNPPSHVLTIPFTRGLAGPFDFTPGVFDVLIPGQPNNRSNMTLGKQLAVYLLIYSPLHMAADLPENYEGHPAFQFIKEVPVDWETTKVLDGKIAENLVITRKDRNSENWYLGAATAEKPYQKQIKLDFLDPTKKYEALIYKDGKNADLINNPTEVEILKKIVSSSDVLDVNLIVGGGLAIQFKTIK